MKFSLVAVGSKVEAFPYLYKLSTILLGIGDLEYIYWGRDRHEDTNKIKGIKYKRIFHFSPNNKLMLLLGYFVWISSLIYYFLFKADSSRLYFVSRLDTAIAIYIASILRKSYRFVYLDRDAYHMTYRLGIFRGLIKGIEKHIAGHAVFHFIPGKSRDFTGGENVRVIENTPNKGFYNMALKKSTNLSKDARFTIYVNGWLVDTRGASGILRLAKMLDPNEYRIIVAGPIECESIKALTDMPVSKYLGQMNNIDSLSYYFVSDVVLSFYDPSIEINRKAEPNKWFDCVFTNTPFIANYGIDTVEIFVEIGLCELVTYNNADALLAKIINMKSRRRVTMYEANQYVEDLGVNFWDDKVIRVIGEYLNSN